ncbi:MAG: hypothetical protein KatS3mg102_1407 [Planctomycetota bacterium]|nr:MAG: hypothetical protein KatS3mg102_1407 [Planctomycetota bacterium]
MERGDPLRHDDRPALRRLAQPAALAGALVLAGIALGVLVLAGGPGQQRAGAERGAAGGRAGAERPGAAPPPPARAAPLAAELQPPAEPAAPDADPPEIRIAIAGGPLPELPPGAAAPQDWRIVPVSGPERAPRADAASPGERARPGLSSGSGAEPGELARRAGWLQRQERRNQLRVRILTQELGLDPARAERVRQALSAFVAAKAALYERLEAEGGSKQLLSTELERLRAELAERLRAELGTAGYEAYAAMEAGGRFALPEEKKRP